MEKKLRIVYFMFLRTTKLANQLVQGSNTTVALMEPYIVFENDKICPEREKSRARTEEAMRSDEITERSSKR